MKLLKQQRLLVFLALILFLFLTFFVQQKTTQLLWDEPVYLSNARSHLEHTYFTEDFRFPLLEFFIAGMWGLTTISVPLAQILIILFSLGSILLFSYISKQFFSTQKWHYLTLLLFAASPLLVWWGFRIYTDIPALFFLLASIACYFAYEKEKKPYWLLLAGFSTSLAFLARYSAAIFALYIFVRLIMKKNYKGLLFFILGNIVFLGTWMTYNFFNYGNPFWDLLEQIHIIRLYTSFQPPKILLSFLWKHLIVLLLGIIPFIWRYKKIEKYYLLTYLIIFSLTYYLFFVGLKLERYVLFLYPFLLLMSLKGFEELTLTIKKTYRLPLFFFILFISVILLSFLHVQQLSTLNEDVVLCKGEGAMKESITFVEEFIPEGDLIISNNWPWYGFYGNHRVRSTWSNNITEVLGDDSHATLILYNKMGLDTSSLMFTGELTVTFTDSCGGIVEHYAIHS